MSDRKRWTIQREVSKHEQVLRGRASEINRVAHYHYSHFALSNESQDGRFQLECFWLGKVSCYMKIGGYCGGLTAGGEPTIGSELFGCLSFIYRICLETCKERLKNDEKNKISKAKSTNLNGHLFLNRIELWRSETDILAATANRLWLISKLKMVDMLAKVGRNQNGSRQTTLGHVYF